jgi:two-component system sensor histidine kinase ChiS
MKRARGRKIMIPISVHETQQSVEDDGVGMDDVFLQRILDRKADGRSGVGLIYTDRR